LEEFPKEETPCNCHTDLQARYVEPSRVYYVDEFLNLSWGAYQWAKIFLLWSCVEYRINIAV